MELIPRLRVKPSVQVGSTENLYENIPRNAREALVAASHGELPYSMYGIEPLMRLCQYDHATSRAALTDSC